MTTDEIRLVADAAGWTIHPTDRHAVLLDLSGVLHADDPVFRRTLVRWLMGAAAHDAAPPTGVSVYELAHSKLVLIIDADVLEDRRKALARVAGSLVEHRRGAIKATWYDLRREAVAFSAAARHLLRIAGAGELPPDHPEDDRMDAFLKLEGGLHAVDLTPLIRQQYAYRIGTKGMLEPILLETTVSVADIERLYDVSMRGNAWLFGLATEILDWRMLHHLVREPSDFPVPVAVKLHAGTIRDPDFGQLLSQFPANKHGRLVVELPYVEWVSDPEAVRAAIATAHRHDLAAALDHVPLTALSKDGLPDVEYVRIPWIDDAGARADMAGARGAIEAFGAERCVLARCGDRKALEDGVGAGFRIFQGAVVTKMAAEKRRIAIDGMGAGVIAEEAKYTVAAGGGVEPPPEPPPSSGAFAWLGRLIGR